MDLPTLHEKLTEVLLQVPLPSSLDRMISKDYVYKTVQFHQKYLEDVLIYLAIKHRQQFYERYETESHFSKEYAQEKVAHLTDLIQAINQSYAQEQEQIEQDLEQVKGRTATMTAFLEETGISPQLLDTIAAQIRQPESADWPGREREADIDTFNVAVNALYLASQGMISLSSRTFKYLIPRIIAGMNQQMWDTVCKDDRVIN